MSFAPKGLSIGRRDDDDEEDWYMGPRWKLLLASIPVAGALFTEVLRYRNDRRESGRSQRHETELERFKARQERRMEKLKHKHRCERLELYGADDTTEPGSDE